ncbi:MAG TPA: hypothetical protein VGQ12_04960 [Candidatus Angelobacter sp.]|jgi:hypothetical protein|nr:hypothetical protein [Candidatus Angelobacter sp.]
MATMSTYCKAVEIETVRRYPEWQERNVCKDGGLPAHVYLHDNFALTLGVFCDEDILFTSDTDEWKHFCTEVLKFQNPVQ